MQNKNHESLTIVQNSYSTNFKQVERRVLQPLRKANVRFHPLETRYKDAADNIKDLADRLPQEGIILSAAGDGTAEQVANAMLVNDSDAALALSPGGNFNDLWAGHMGKKSIMDMIDEKGEIRDDLHTVDVHPVTVEINDREKIDAFSYVSFGLTALIAAGFRTQEARDRLRAMPKVAQKIIRNGQAGIDYLTYKNEKLPDFRVDDGEIQHGMTDIAIANNPIVAGIIRASDTYYDKPYFGVEKGIDMAKFSSLIEFGIPSLFGHSPLEKMTQMRIRFEKAAEPLRTQVGGEYYELEGVENIFFYKDPSKKVRFVNFAGAA